MASKQLQTVLRSIIKNANTHKDDIPAITTTQIAPFPYEIVVYPPLVGAGNTGIGATGAHKNGEDESWGSVFKKMLDS